MRLSRLHLGPYGVKRWHGWIVKAEESCEVVKVKQIMGQSPNVRDKRKERMND